MGAVIKSCVPFNPLRAFICVTMGLGTFGALLLLPSLFEVQAVTLSMALFVLAGAVICGAAAFALEKGRRLLYD